MSGRDPVTVRPGRVYARVDLDVWPLRLTEDGQQHVKRAIVAAIDQTTDIDLTTPGRVHRLTGFSHGPSGCHVDRIDKTVAESLAEVLRRVVFEPELVREITV